MIVPARTEEEGSLRVTLPGICRAAKVLDCPVEILLVAPADLDWAKVSEPLELDKRLVRRIVTQPLGKFAALSVGVQAATGEHLILVDADVMASPDSFVHVLGPLLSGEADVCAGRICLSERTNKSLMESLLERWSSVSFEAWHEVRTYEPSLCWQLPGALYAIRRDFFPTEVPVSGVDDGSIGLFVTGRGGRLQYAPQASAYVLAPSCYRDWFKQKWRTYRGRALLARHYPLEVKRLRRTFAHHLRVAASEEPTGWLLRMHDRCLTIFAWLAVHAGFLPSGAWKPAKSTKPFPI